MFEKKITQEDLELALREQSKEIYAEATMNAKKLISGHEIEINKLNADHEIVVKEKDHLMKHLESEVIKTLQNEKTVLEKRLAVLEKENEMLGKITDLNADVIDVKSLVSDLIGKLPEIKITSLGNTVNNTGK